MRMDIMDDDIIDREEDPPPWYPLETILSSWIEMILMGKITPSPKNVRPLNEKYDPWVNHRYSHKQLREAVDALHRLMEAIESRMPDPPRQETSRAALLDGETLARARVADPSVRPHDAHHFGTLLQAWLFQPQTPSRPARSSLPSTMTMRTGNPFHPYCFSVPKARNTN